MTCRKLRFRSKECDVKFNRRSAVVSNDITDLMWPEVDLKLIFKRNKSSSKAWRDITAWACNLTMWWMWSVFIPWAAASLQVLCNFCLPSALCCSLFNCGCFKSQPWTLQSAMWDGNKFLSFILKLLTQTCCLFCLKTSTGWLTAPVSDDPAGVFHYISDHNICSDIT